jgi:hypothetical protein
LPILLPLKSLIIRTSLPCCRFFGPIIHILRFRGVLRCFRLFQRAA